MLLLLLTAMINHWLTKFYLITFLRSIKQSKNIYGYACVTYFRP